MNNGGSEEEISAKASPRPDEIRPASSAAGALRNRIYENGVGKGTRLGVSTGEKA